MARLRLKNLLENSRFLASLNICADDPRVAMIVNEFELQALPFGRWWGTTQLIQTCTAENGCLVLPRGVAAIEAIGVGGRNMRPSGQYWDFISPHAEWGSCSGLSCGCNGCESASVKEGGLVASFGTTTGINSKIRVYSGGVSDDGKKIIIQGNDKNGVWVRTLIDGVYQDGEQVTLAAPFVDTVTVWGPGAPMAVMKDVTDHPVKLYAVEQTTTDETQLAEYDPTETEPSYRRVYLNGIYSTSCSGLRAVVSLDQVTIRHENDWLLFHNLEAYRQGMKSILYRDEGNQAMADAYFFGTNRSSKNARGVLRYSEGMGALPILRAELRKHTGDRTDIAIHQDGLNLQGFV